MITYKVFLRVTSPHIVILGAGFGGLTAAINLRDVGARVTIVDRNNHHLFQPLLYQVATAGLSPGEIAQPIRAILRQQKNTEVLMDEVSGIDRASRHVILRSGHQLHYDHLVVATGARHSYFANPEWEEFAPGLKSISDATKIRKRILVAFEKAELEEDPERRKALLTFILVGAGPTGVEMAGSIAEMSTKALKSDFRHFDPSSAKVILIEAAPRILGQFPEELARDAREELARLGVEVRTGSRVEMIDAEGVTVGGERIAAGTVVWAAGVQASKAGKWLNAEVDRAGRVVVTDQLTLADDDTIFVIGDTALAKDEADNALPGVATVAMQQGRYVAKVLRAKLKHEPQPERFHYKDKGSLATVGRAFAIAAIGRTQMKGFLAWVLWLTVHIFYLIGFRNRVVVLFQWAWAYLTYQRGVRLIVND